ncbi:MAG: DUF2889 domain-containing protein [Alphaproteobacteria bacterium]|nr:DUF2889 domain-containing protein [Alphaproteobacteria bacterium]
MPLPTAVARSQLHTRRVECRGYHRDDGLWDIEGWIVDTKTYDTARLWRSPLGAGEAIHDMSLRLTVDVRLVIQDAVAVTDASPFAICVDAAPNMTRLKGLRIGPGWMRTVKERLGGRHGCTHIVELLGPVATTAYQTIFSDRGPAKRVHPRVNSCYAYAEDSPIIARLREEKAAADD